MFFLFIDYKNSSLHFILNWLCHPASLLINELNEMLTHVHYLYENYVFNILIIIFDTKCQTVG